MSNIMISQVTNKNGKGHKYKVTGDPRVDPDIPLPTISTIARHADIGGGDGLLYWAVDAYIQTGIRNAFADKRDDAAAIGKDLHSSIEEYIYTQQQPKNASPLFGAWYSDLHEKGIEWHGSEMMVYSHTGFAGTVDAIGYLDGVPTIFDWKTTNELDKNGKRKKLLNDPTHATQIGGYLRALRTMATNFPEIPQPTQAFIVYVFRDTLTVKWREVSIPHAMRAFVMANILHKITVDEGGLLYEH